MKLFLPLGVIFFAAASCCCCGDPSSFGSQFGIDVPSADGGPAVTVTGDATADGGATVSVGGSALAGTCGRFKEGGLTAPSGFSVMVCSEGGGADSIVLSGSSDPGEACKVVKGWAEGQGWATEYDTQASGTTAVTMKKGTERLVIGCTSMAGQTTVSVSFTAM